MYRDSYDVIIIGGGHAGCEAALASARLGARTLMLNLSVDNTALMPCNPSIGGPAKGHLVRELSALGGEQARAADASTLLVRWLNTSKGVAVRALRAQCDPYDYAGHYTSVTQTCGNLEVHQDEVVELWTEEGEIRGLRTRHGSVYEAKAVVICSGTYLRGHIHLGGVHFDSGPMGQTPALGLSGALLKEGFRTMRMRTDTPPRLHLDTLDFSSMTRQESAEEPLAFDFWSERRVHRGYACWFTHTRPETHEAIFRNLDRSPLRTGQLETHGPRYCPSIEDKLIRFPDKERHPIFFEPLSKRNKEVYVQNLSTSLPYDVQVEMVRTLPGCEKAKILKPGYGIEYDVLPPDQLYATLETKRVRGLFCAGQINGTSGYEEAAAQGFLAGVNAALSVTGEEPLVLGRNQAYLGVLVDDLVTKGTEEPYRMLTSRCEHRLLLRHDNAARRLAPIGRRLGLIDDERWGRIVSRWRREDAELDRMRKTRLPITDALRSRFMEAGVAVPDEPQSLATLLCRRGVDWRLLSELSPPAEALSDEEIAWVGAEIRYEGYIEHETRAAGRLARMDAVKVPDDFDYDSVTGLLAESRQKLAAVRPRSLGQGARIAGVTPTDIQLLSFALEARARKGREETL